jgi:hypothetical protein
MERERARFQLGHCHPEDDTLSGSILASEFFLRRMGHGVCLDHIG